MSTAHAVTPSIPTPFLHDVHKFQEIQPKLERDNWVKWKMEIIAIMKDRGLYDMITGADPKPSSASSLITTISGVPHIGTVPLAQLERELNSCNNCAYSQILLTISPDLQISINHTNEAKVAWRILCNKFKSHDPSKVSNIREKYENYQMEKDQPVSLHINMMKTY